MLKNNCGIMYNMNYVTITYVGKNPGFIARVDSKVYEFEWNKGLGIGNRIDEVRPVHVKRIAKWRDKKGKRIFVCE
jgi:hypothetical protein